MMELNAYERLYDVCEENGYELEILIYEYARKRTATGKWDRGRIGLRVKTRNEDGEPEYLWSLSQSHGSVLKLDDLAIKGLNFLEKKKFIS